MRYSNLRLVQEMCKSEPYALHVNGEFDDVEHITPQDLYEAYQKAIREDQLDLYVIGDVDTDQVKTAVDTYFKTEERELQPLKEARRMNSPIRRKSLMKRTSSRAS